MIKRLMQAVANIRRWIRIQHKIPHWSSLSQMGQNRLLRSSYFWLFAVPLTALLLSKTGPELQIPVWKSTLTLPLALPFSWRMFYFSAVAFAVASFLYSARAPRLIRKHDNYAAFQAAGGGPLEILSTLFALYGSDSEAHMNTRNRFKDLFLEDLSPYYLTWDGMTKMSFKKDSMPDAFHWLYSKHDVTRPLARFLCYASYVVGFIFIFLVIWQNFLYVWRFV